MSRHTKTSGLSFALALWLTACGGGGGAGGSGNPTPPSTPPLTANELAVLVAEGDATSEAIGLAYQQARGVPAANVVRLPVPTGSDVMSAAEFDTFKTALDARLPAGVQATLITWSRPSRVVGPCAMGLTSALAFGYDARYCGQCNTTAASALYDNPTHRPFTDLRIRPSMMLGAATLAEAQTLIARGVAADGSWLNNNVSTGRSGQGYLVRTSDAARNGRFDDFQALAATTVAGLTWRYIDNAAGQSSDVVANQANLMFYFTGLVSVPQIATNTWLPGAAADHLTSFGGVLSGSVGGQMPATDWLRAGATASYGTVEEPCSFADKFPRASVLVRRYTQGDTLIEAYWKSVRTPGQGLFVGEPLARPWAR